MRWIKHLTCASRDERMSKLIDEMGMAGYGSYWLILERIGEQMDKSGKCSLALPPRSWVKMMGRYHVHHTLIYLQSLSNLTSISFEFTDDLWTATCRNLLKYRDEYSERKNKSRDNVPSESRECPEQDTDTDTEKNKDIRVGADAPHGPSEFSPPQEENPNPYVCQILCLEDGKTLGIRKKDADRWQEAYRLIDVQAELHALEEWAEREPEKRWSKKAAFHACSASLRRKNQEVTEHMRTVDPTFDSDDPRGDKRAEAEVERTRKLIEELAADKGCPF